LRKLESNHPKRGRNKSFPLAPALHHLILNTGHFVMKTILVALFILCAASAFGQAGSISAQAQPMQMSEHPEHASQHEMAMERPLVGAGPNAYTYAQGERPLWEFGPVSQPTPLGDIARAVRKEKLTARKAEIVFEKQGS
jgi:hypothetical protein